MCVCVRVSVCVYLCVYPCVCVCVCVCVCALTTTPLLGIFFVNTHYYREFFYWVQLLGTP